MFYHINGVVTDIEPNLVVLECGGVGYALNASLNTISSVKTGERVKLYTYEIIREDAHDLYGFASKSEKHCFELLLAISGVGPKAALSILSSNTPDGLALAVLNGDDALLAGLELPFETILCGRGENCAVRVTDIVTHGVEGLSCTVTTPCGVYPLHIPSPGDYMIYPASMAVAIGERLGLTAQQIREGVARYVSTGSRMRRIRLPEERLIIDDCYNANPQAMAAALTILADTDCRRRVAVMGDMGELGRLSSDAHREAGVLAARLGLDQVIAIGEKARLMAQGAGNIALHFDTVEQAMPAVQEALTPGTAMLVKASHAMEFHRIVEALTQEA